MTHRQPPRRRSRRDRQQRQQGGELAPVFGAGVFVLVIAVAGVSNLVGGSESSRPLELAEVESVVEAEALPERAGQVVDVQPDALEDVPAEPAEPEAPDVVEEPEVVEPEPAAETLAPTEDTDCKDEGG